ncbi:MAG TPA: hypothetical protein VG099_24665 [Gemmataceae bacterium]|jgi:hypothetical protein|nr:hypothetical protein [Gemmataceae bacterium]
MKFEYAWSLIQPGQELATANAAGQDGWEVCAVYDRILSSSPLAGAQQQLACHMIFKRPIVEELVPDGNDRPKRLVKLLDGA